jgi:hypothetical protein
MYSTRRLNSRMVDNNAYITIGDPYVTNKDVIPDRFRGKKFTIIRKPENAGNGMFSKVTYAPEPYIASAEKYLESQPFDKRKNGFGSKDAMKRGEFTNYIRTEQYRESIKAENEILNKGRDYDAEKAVLKKYADIEAAKPKKFLYDIGRSKVTQFDPKQPKDCHFVIGRKAKREAGPYSLSSTQIGMGAEKWKYTSSEHAPTSMVKKFFDASHLEVPGF